MSKQIVGLTGIVLSSSSLLVGVIYGGFSLVEIFLGNIPIKNVFGVTLGILVPTTLLGTSIYITK